MTGSDRERDVEALAAFLRTIPSKRETETFGQYDRRRARAVLASDWLAERIAAAQAETAGRFRIAAELTVQDVRAQRGDHIAELVEDSFAAHFDRAAEYRIPPKGDR